jgi:hypothetical protein
VGRFFKGQAHRVGTLTLLNRRWECKKRLVEVSPTLLISPLFPVDARADTASLRLRIMFLARARPGLGRISGAPRAALLSARVAPGRKRAKVSLR